MPSRARSRSVPDAAVLSSRFACGSRSLSTGVRQGPVQARPRVPGCNFPFSTKCPGRPASILKKTARYSPAPYGCHGRTLSKRRPLVSASRRRSANLVPLRLERSESASGHDSHREQGVPLALFFKPSSPTNLPPHPRRNLRSLHRLPPYRPAAHCLPPVPGRRIPAFPYRSLHRRRQPPRFL